MLPGKKFLLILGLALVIVLGVFYFKNQKLALKPSSPYPSPPPKQTVFLPAKTLSPEEIKRLARNIPDLRKLTKPVEPANVTAAKKLSEADNVLLYSTDPNDTTGRTMLVDTRVGGVGVISRYNQ